MKNVRALVALFLISVFLAGNAEAANTPQVNPNVPGQNAPLQSSTLRGNFQAIYNDFATIFNILYLGANQILGSLSGGNAVPINMPSCSTGALSWTSGVGFGCNSINGLTSPVSTSLVFTGAISFNQNTAALPTKQTGTVLQLGNADGTASRIENDAFAAPSYFTGIRFDGTNASPTTLQSGDEISGINAWGYNGTAVVGPRASVREYAAQNWTTSANGTYVDIATTLNGTTTMSPGVRVENDGGVMVPATVSGGSKGAGTINATGIYAAGTQLQNGSFTAGSNMTITGSWPNLTFSSSSGGSGSGTVNSGTAPDLSYYATSTAAVSDATGLQYNASTKGLGFTSTGAVAAGFTGVHSTAANTLALSTSGSDALTISTTQSVGIGTALPTSPLTINGGSNGQVIEIDSSSTSGTYFFLNNTATNGHNWQISSYPTATPGPQLIFFDQTAGIVPLSLNGTSHVVDTTSGGVYGWVNNANFSDATAADTGISRPSAAIIDFGNGSANDTSGKLKAAAYMSVGTKFTASGCSNSATVGGATAGTITLGANTCSVTVTMGNSSTAPNGWACSAKDLTAPTIPIGETTGGSTTTAILSIPSGAGATDAVAFFCMGY